MRRGRYEAEGVLIHGKPILPERRRVRGALCGSGISRSKYNDETLMGLALLDGTASPVPGTREPHV